MRKNVSENPSEKIINGTAQTSFPDFTVSVSVPCDSLKVLGILLEAIDYCSLNGGGSVVVENGPYCFNGPFVLKSGVNLHL